MSKERTEQRADDIATFASEQFPGEHYIVIAVGADGAGACDVSIISSLSKQSQAFLLDSIADDLQSEIDEDDDSVGVRVVEVSNG